MAAQTSRKLLLRAGAGLVLALGLGLAARIYVAAPADAPAQGYSLEGGQSFETSPWDSRSFRRGMEQIGGKQALLFTELREKWASLLSGVPLAVIVGLGTAAAAGALLYLAERQPGD